MELDYNKKIMLKVIKEKPQLGKTAVMKIMFILQQIFEMNLGYNFNIYTYGPYAAEVSEDLETLIYNDLVDAEVFEYKNSMAYRLKMAECANSSLGDISPQDKGKIATVLSVFGSKTAKEIELDSTIMFITNLYDKNKKSEKKADIIADVHEIKPHFTAKEIENAFDRLKEEQMLRKATR